MKIANVSFFHVDFNSTPGLCYSHTRQKFLYIHIMLFPFRIIFFIIFKIYIWNGWHGVYDPEKKKTFLWNRSRESTAWYQCKQGLWRCSLCPAIFAFWFFNNSLRNIIMFGRYFICFVNEIRKIIFFFLYFLSFPPSYDSLVKKKI